MAAARKSEARVKKLRKQALEFSSAGKHDKAAEAYSELSVLDPSNGEWPRRAADCYWHLKDTAGRLKYALLAARAYSESGLMLKAIAMCKVVLSIDPSHKETQARLAKLHPRRPQTQTRRQPPGVTRHSPVLAPLKRAAAENLEQPTRRNSLRPLTKEAEERQAERTRARMAAAAALRQARAQLRKQAVEKAREKRTAPESNPNKRAVVSPAGSAPSGPVGKPAKESREPDKSKLYLGPIREEVAVQSRRRDVVGEDPPPREAMSNSRHSAAFGPTIPAFRLEPASPSRKLPALEALRLSERVQAFARESGPPSEGIVYSLTLSEVPQAELRAARIPRIAAPSLEALEPESRVPIIEPWPERPTPLDSLIPSDLSFNRRLSGDRAAVSQRSFAEIPLLCELEQDVLQRLITDVALVELDANEVLFHEGDPADAMYVVVEGSVTAMTLPHGEKPIELARLKEGEFFGEIGLMSDQPRQATITAHEPCRLLRFDREVVAILIESDPTFLSTLLEFIKNRLVEDLMMSSPLFAPLSEQERYDLAEQFEFLEVEPNSLLLERGQHPIGMYVLLTGEASMKGASEAGTIRRLGQGDILGEQALLNNEPSRVEVRTVSKCFALCLPSDAFPEVIMTHPTVLKYLTTLPESSKGELDVADDFLDHVRFF
jgi:CRP-like cAMP-binding protein